jgi:hypothetical protein
VKFILSILFVSGRPILDFSEIGKKVNCHEKVEKMLKPTNLSDIVDVLV